MAYRIGHRDATRRSLWMLEKIDTAPWFTKRDRDDVCRLLYSDNIEEQKRGIDRLAAWRARTHPNIPLGLEVTSSLLIALMPVINNNKIVGRDDSFIEQESKRLNLAIALIRFINLVTSIGQVTSFAINSISIASKMGVPEWIVDIRHNSTHSTIPSTKMLIDATKFALSWTKTHFWDADDPLDVCKEVAVVDGDDAPAIEKINLSHIFVKTQIEWLNWRRNECGSNEDDRVTLEQLQLEWLKDTETDVVTKALLHNGLLAEPRDPNDVEAYEKLFKSEADQVKWLEPFWMPILNNFYLRPGFFQAFVQELVLAATRPSSNASEDRNIKLALEWLLVILKRSSQSYPLTNLKQLLRDVLLLLPTLEQHRINGNAVQLLTRLKEINTSLLDKKRNPRQEASFGISTLKTNAQQNVTDAGAWKYCSAKEWSKFAIGIDKDDNDNWFADKLVLTVPSNDDADQRESSDVSRNLKRKR